MKRYVIHRAPREFQVDYEHDLNPEQHAAVLHGDGPALVLAGAGTGKTRVVTYRVARLIESGVAPDNILLVTFTNKAAREMLRRVDALVGGTVSGIFGGTFHHIAHLLLRQHAPLIGYRQGFSILDREDAKDLADSCVAEIYRKDVRLPKGSVLAEMQGLSTSTGRTLDEVLLRRFPHFLPVAEEIGVILERYGQKKRKLNLVDFDDLLDSWRRLFADHERIREYYMLKFRYILVDEFQDTNRLQADIIDLTAGPGGNLMVVGDDAQSIYSFRGADFDNILRFPERYPGTGMYRLTTNYRSTPEILRLANSVIANNRMQFSKELRTGAPSGERPALVPLQDTFQQAAFVASVVTDLNADGTPLDRQAVLYRSHYQSMELQMELQRRAIPFEVRSGLKFFEQAHIKDILSYLKVISNQHDEIAWKRVLKLVPGIGTVTAGKIWQRIGAADTAVEALAGMQDVLPRRARSGYDRFLMVVEQLAAGDYAARPADAVDYILRHGYEDHLYSMYEDAEARIEDVEQMIRFASRYDALDVFLSEMTLQGVADSADVAEDASSEERLVLTTVHQAKGLEWDVVFIIGLTDGRFPSSKSLKSEEDEEEERRLFYVGVTRARESLYLCYPVSFDEWQAQGFSRPSRFLREVPLDCFEEVSVQG